MPRPAGSEILEGSFDRLLTPGTKDVTFHVIAGRVRRLLRGQPPGAAVARPRHGAARLPATRPSSTPSRSPAHDPYSVTARVPLRGDADGGLTENKLRAAGEAYPPELLARYTQLTPTAVGPRGPAGPRRRAAQARGQQHPGEPVRPGERARRRAPVGPLRLRRRTSSTSTAETSAGPSASRRTSRATASSTRR